MAPERKRARHSGFTLIELMITVSIIGVLSATAITLFQGQQLRSKRSEGMTNVEAVAKMARAYFGELGSYPTVFGYWPAPVMTTVPAQWDNASTAAFGAMGFRAEGAVRFRYDIDAAAECPACASGACFSAFAYSDLEGDGRVGGVAFFHRDAAAVECPSTQPGNWLAPVDSSGNPVYDAAAPYFASPIPLGPDDY